MLGLKADMENCIRHLAHKRNNVLAKISVAIVFGLCVVLMLLGTRIDTAIEQDGFFALSTGNKAAVSRNAAQDEYFDGNIVLAAAVNTSTVGVSVFVQSWAQYAPGNKIVLLCEPSLAMSPGLSTMLREYRVEVIPVELPNEIDDPEDEEEIPKPGRLSLQVLKQSLQYLQTGGAGAQGVALVLNAGDVVLQGNPFKDTSVQQNLARDGVVVASEGGPELGAVTVNVSEPIRSIIMDCFGGSMASRMGKIPVINGEVIIGSLKGMTQLVTLLVDVLATRTRGRCLWHERADLGAVQYAIGEFGRDHRNVDFAFSLRDHVTSTVFGVKYGLPAKVDSKGILRRSIPKGGIRRGPTPTVITQYSYNSYLAEMYINKYRLYLKDNISFD